MRILAEILVGILVFLSVSWLVTTTQEWESHGCTQKPWVLALTHGEPEWYQYCSEESK